MERLYRDPYVLYALWVYLGGVAGLGGLMVLLSSLRRGAFWSRIDRVKETVGGPHATAPLPPGDDVLVYREGAKAARVGEEMPPGGPRLEEVERFAIVKDADGQTGLVLTVDGEDLGVTGLEEIGRVLERVQADEPEFEFVFQADESTRIRQALQRLPGNELALVDDWIVEDEVITDVVTGVDFEGDVRTPGGKGAATLIVTNLRVALIARTIQVESVQGGTRRRTHFNLISYPLPVARKVTIEVLPSVRSREYLLRLDLPDDVEGADDAPVLKLTQDHTGVFVPICLFQRPVEVIDHGTSAGTIVRDLLGATGWGILVGGLALGAALIPYANDSWYERYLGVAAVGGFLTPFLFRTLAWVEGAVERRRSRSAHRAASGEAG